MAALAVNKAGGTGVQARAVLSGRRWLRYALEQRGNPAGYFSGAWIEGA